MADTMQGYIDRIKELEHIISDLKEEIDDLKREQTYLEELAAGEDI